MPSKKRKYNARFPAGRIKKIMQTDEEVGKVAQAVPIIIYLTPRTLELFVESLLTKALQVTTLRSAKTLSPSHVKQCILAESRFDFLRDLVKNIPDVSAAEEKESVSAETSPNTSRFTDMTVPPRRVAREDSNSSSSSDARLHQNQPPSETLKRTHSSETEAPIRPTATVVSGDAVIDLSKKAEEKPSRTPNFYQETLNIDDPPEPKRSVIRVNPKYGSLPQPSTSSLTTPPIPDLHPLQRIDLVPKKPLFHIDLSLNNNNSMSARTPATPVTPVLNIDFTKNLAKPEIRVLDNAAASIVAATRESATRTSVKLPMHRQNSKSQRFVEEPKKLDEVKRQACQPPNFDHFPGNLQIDEDYDT